MHLDQHGLEAQMPRRNKELLLTNIVLCIILGLVLLSFSVLIFISMSGSDFPNS